MQCPENRTSSWVGSAKSEIIRDGGEGMKKEYMQAERLNKGR